VTWQAAELPSDWELAPIEVLAEPKGIAYGVLKPGPRTPGGVPMLRVSDIQNSEILREDIYHITPQLDREFRRTKLRGSEVLISIQGSVGRVAVVPDDLAGANISRTLAMIRLSDPNLAPWLRRVLEAPQSQQAMREVIGGTTRDSLNLRDLRRLLVPVAPEPLRSIILTRMEAGLAQTASVQGRLAKAQRATGQLRSALLAAACSGRLVEA
jgi:type I restriction enzyme S subunit